MGGKPTSLLNGDHVTAPTSRDLPTAESNPASGHQTDSSSVSSTLNQSQHTFVLTESERKLVKQTWTRLQKQSVSQTGNGDDNSDSALTSAVVSRRLDELGVLVFLRIFELSPETRNAFPQFQKMEDSALVGNVVFRCHARRFIRSVESVLNDVDSIDLIVLPNLHRLGHRHRDFPGFEPRYLRAFETAMDDIWMSQLGCRNYGPSTKKAWNKVFRLITSTVHQGYGVDNNTASPAAQCPDDVTDSANLAVAEPGESVTH